MRLLVNIDLTAADLAIFESYEATVLPLVAKHGGRLEMRVRTLDGFCETHLLFFPDEMSLEAYRSDPERVAVLSEWEASGARSARVAVEQVGA